MSEVHHPAKPATQPNGASVRGKATHWPSPLRLFLSDPHQLLFRRGVRPNDAVFELSDFPLHSTLFSIVTNSPSFLSSSFSLFLSLVEVFKIWIRLLSILFDVERLLFGHPFLSSLFPFHFNFWQLLFLFVSWRFLAWSFLFVISLCLFRLLFKFILFPLFQIVNPSLGYLVSRLVVRQGYSATIWSNRNELNYEFETVSNGKNMISGRNQN